MSVTFLDDPRPAAAQEVERVSRFSFTDDRLVYAKVLYVHRAEQIADLLRR